MLQKQFKYLDEEGNYNLIDTAGNHFVNGKCINPKVGEGYVGETHNPPVNATSLLGLEVTGHIEL